MPTWWENCILTNVSSLGCRRLWVNHRSLTGWFKHWGEPMGIIALITVNNLMRLTTLAWFCLIHNTLYFLGNHLSKECGKISDSTSGCRLFIYIETQWYSVFLRATTRLIRHVYSFWPIPVFGWDNSQRDNSLCGFISRWIYRCGSQVQYSQHTRTIPSLFFSYKLVKDRREWPIVQKKQSKQCLWETKPSMIWTAHPTLVPGCLHRRILCCPLLWKT